MSRREFIGRLDPQFNPFDEDYLFEILEATAIAWARMEQPRNEEIENAITRRLAARLQLDTHFDDLPYDVVPQCQFLSLSGDIICQYDLRFKHLFSRRDYFVFEAKRLHVTYPAGSFSTEYSTYAGINGMMAFVEGEYCKGLPAAGMLSYIMDGESKKAWNGLEEGIETRRKLLKLSNNSKFAKSVLAKAIQNGVAGTHLGETEHDLPTHRLRLFHLLLPVQTTTQEQKK